MSCNENVIEEMSQGDLHASHLCESKSEVETLGRGLASKGLSAKDAKRIVIKVGTSTLTYDTGRVNIRRIESLVKVISDIKNAGYEIILCSSGAMAVGRGKIGMKEKPTDIPTKQAVAAIGQGELMHVYDTLFGAYNHNVAQVLLTKDVVDIPIRRKHVVDTFLQLLNMDCIPIVNENDTVSVEEIEFGDNDTLSAIVAGLCHADLLIIMSDIDGLYDSDPNKNPDAKLIPKVETIDKSIIDMASGSTSNRGTGGMITKIHAAETASKDSVDMVIVNGSDPNILYDLIDGKEVGTYFVSKGV